MKIALLSKVAVSLILLASLCHPVRALELLLDAQNTGYAWYQAQDENRILSFYGASSTVEIGGSSARPILDIQIIPEANALLLLGAGALVLLLPRRHSYRRQF